METVEIVRTLAVFSVCRMQLIVRNCEKLLKFSRGVFGDGFVATLVRPTFFAHFCGGEDLDTIKPRMALLKSRGVGGILDYAAEGDVPEEEFEDPVEVVTARQYSYTTERQCDSNQEIFETAIRNVAGVTPGGFAAIKVTGLCNPKLLERWSDSIVAARELFRKMDLDHDGKIAKSEFSKAWDSIFNEVAVEVKDTIFSQMDTSNSGRIDPVEWMTYLDPINTVKIAALAKDSNPFKEASDFTKEEQELIRSMRTRVQALIKLADELDVRVMVDAEQTYFQPAIDAIVLDLQRQYNMGRDRVYGTVQCYLKDSRDRNRGFMLRAEREGWEYAAKVVRGAYMFQEADRAAEMGRANPVHDGIEDTHRNYNAVIEDIIMRPNVTKGKEKPNIVVATHNQESVEKTVALIEAAGLEPGDSGVVFGQLLGMSDHLTYTLGNQGYLAYKYVPYGPVMETLPYLVRRLQENSDILASVSNEMPMLSAELIRRLTGKADTRMAKSASV